MDSARFKPYCYNQAHEPENAIALAFEIKSRDDVVIGGRCARPGDYFVIQYSGTLCICSADEFYRYFDLVSFSAVDGNEVPLIKACDGYEAYAEMDSWWRRLVGMLSVDKKRVTLSSGESKSSVDYDLSKLLDRCRVVETSPGMNKSSYYTLYQYLDLGEKRDMRDWSPLTENWYPITYADFRGVCRVDGDGLAVVKFKTRYEAERALFRFIHGDSDVVY